MKEGQFDEEQVLNEDEVTEGHRSTLTAHYFRPDLLHLAEQ